jgi:ABC-type transporter Mla subunit MlaD
MDDERPQLASIATALDELTDRITTIAEGTATTAADVSADLYEIERILRQAARRLDRLVSNR